MGGWRDGPERDSEVGGGGAGQTTARTEAKAWAGIVWCRQSGGCSKAGPAETQGRPFRPERGPEAGQRERVGDSRPFADLQEREGGTRTGRSTWPAGATGTGEGLRQDPAPPEGGRLEGQNLGLLSPGGPGGRCVGWAAVTPRCGFLPGQHPARRLRLGQSPHSLQGLLLPGHTVPPATRAVAGARAGGAVAPHSYLPQRSWVTSGAMLSLSERSPSCNCGVTSALLPSRTDGRTDVGAARQGRAAGAAGGRCLHRRGTGSCGRPQALLKRTGDVYKTRQPPGKNMNLDQLQEIRSVQRPRVWPEALTCEAP